MSITTGFSKNGVDIGTLFIPQDSSNNAFMAATALQLVTLNNWYNFSGPITLQPGIYLSSATFQSGTSGDANTDTFIGAISTQVLPGNTLFQGLLTSVLAYANASNVYNGQSNSCTSVLTFPVATTVYILAYIINTENFYISASASFIYLGAA